MKHLEEQYLGFTDPLVVAHEDIWDWRSPRFEWDMFLETVQVLCEKKKKHENNKYAERAGDNIKGSEARLRYLGIARNLII